MELYGNTGLFLTNSNSWIYLNSEIRLVGGFLDLVKVVQILPQEPLRALEGVFEPL